MGQIVYRAKSEPWRDERVRSCALKYLLLWNEYFASINIV